MAASVNNVIEELSNLIAGFDKVGMLSEQMSKRVEKAIKNISSSGSMKDLQRNSKQTEVALGQLNDTASMSNKVFSAASRCFSDLLKNLSPAAAAALDGAKAFKTYAAQMLSTKKAADLLQGGFKGIISGIKAVGQAIKKNPIMLVITSIIGVINAFAEMSRREDALIMRNLQLAVSFNVLYEKGDSYSKVLSRIVKSEIEAYGEEKKLQDATDKYSKAQDVFNKKIADGTVKMSDLKAVNEAYADIVKIKNQQELDGLDKAATLVRQQISVMEELSKKEGQQSKENKKLSKEAESSMSSFLSAIKGFGADMIGLITLEADYSEQIDILYASLAQVVAKIEITKQKQADSNEVMKEAAANVEKYKEAISTITLQSVLDESEKILKSSLDKQLNLRVDYSKKLLEEEANEEEINKELQEAIQKEHLETYNLQLKLLKKSLADTKINAKDRIKIEERIAELENTINTESAEKQIRINEDTYKKIVEERVKAEAEKRKKLSLEREKEKTALAEYYSQYLLNEDQYQEAIANLELSWIEDKNDREIQEEKIKQGKLERLRKDRDAAEREFYNNLASYALTFSNESTKIFDTFTQTVIKSLVTLKQKQKEAGNDSQKQSLATYEAVLTMANGVSVAISSIFQKTVEDQQACLDKQKEQLQSYFDMLSYQRELDLQEAILELQGKGLAEEEYQARVQELETQTAMKQAQDSLDQARLEEQLRQEEAKAKHDAAVQEKAISIMQAAISGALAILNIWATVPKFDFGISTGILTGVAAAITAAQMAVIAATPIPEYKEGGDIKRKHIGLVGEVQPEVIKTRDGVEVIDKPTIKELNPGDKIFPSIEEYNQQQVK